MTASPRSRDFGQGDRCRGKLMARNLILDPEHWRFRAEEPRTIGDQMTHEGARAIMRRIALDYDRLAKVAEEQLDDGSGLDRWRCLRLRRWGALDVPPADLALKSVGLCSSGRLPMRGHPLALRQQVTVTRGIATIWPVGSLPEPSSSSFLPTSCRSGCRLCCRFAWS